MASKIPYKIMLAMDNSFVLDCMFEPLNSASIHKAHGGDNQVFFLEPVGEEFYIRAKHNKYVLGVGLFSLGAQGESLHFYKESTNDDERLRWKIISNKFGGLSIVSFRGTVIGPKNGNIHNQNFVVLWDA